MQCRQPLFVSFIIIAMLACLATAQQRGRTPVPHGEGGAESAPPASQAKLVTRVYDVKDLIRPKRDYPFQSIVVPPMHIGSRQEGDGQSLFGGGGGMPPASGIDAAAAVSSEGLINIVTTTIAPGSWRSAGGFEGSLAFQDGLLIISQTEERQQQIGDLLNQLRKDLGPARTVTIKADWVLLPPGQLATFLKENKGGPQEVDIDSINKSNPKARYTGQLSCFNGQTVHIASITGRTMVRNLEPVVAQSAVGYRADVMLAQAGATLQITPQVSKEGSTAVIDVQSLVTEWDEPADVHKPAPTTAINDGVSPWFLIDHQNVNAQQLRTTLRIPLNKPILIGGMTMSPTLKSGDASQLYLIVELTASAGE